MDALKSTTDSDDESDFGINDAVPVPSTSEMQKMIKSMRRYLDAHSNGEMNKTMDGLKQLANNMVLKKTLQKRYLIFPQKNNNFFTCFLFQWMQPTSSLTGNRNEIKRI